MKATALYREFSSRQELQLAAIAEIAVDIEPDPDVSNWQDALRQVVDRPVGVVRAVSRGSAGAHGSARGLRGSDASYRGDRAETGRAWCPRRGRGAAFAFDFVGDTTLETFVSIQPYLTADEGGRTGVERIGEMTAGHPDVFGVQSMGERGNLDLKVEFIIAGMELGLFPGSVAQK